MNHGLYTVINLTLIPQTLLLSAHTHIVDGRQPCVAHRCVSAFNAGAALGNLTDTTLRTHSLSAPVYKHAKGEMLWSCQHRFDIIIVIRSALQSLSTSPLDMNAIDVESDSITSHLWFLLGAHTHTSHNVHITFMTPTGL